MIWLPASRESTDTGTRLRAQFRPRCHASYGDRAVAPLRTSRRDRKQQRNRSATDL